MAWVIKPSWVRQRQCLAQKQIILKIIIRHFDFYWCFDSIRNSFGNSMPRLVLQSDNITEEILRKLAFRDNKLQMEWLQFGFSLVYRACSITRLKNIGISIRGNHPVIVFSNRMEFCLAKIRFGVNG